MAGEAPVGEDEDGVAVGYGPVGRCCGVFALVLARCGAERAEGGGVAAGLGGEVAAEAEHVRPGGQPQVGQVGELAEAQAFGDEAAGVLADRERRSRLSAGVMRRSRVPVHSAALVAYLAT